MCHLKLQDVLKFIHKKSKSTETWADERKFNYFDGVIRSYIIGNGAGDPRKYWEFMKEVEKKVVVADSDGIISAEKEKHFH